jgi:hypothetical protein
VDPFDHALTRARRRKSSWNLLLIPATCASWGILTCMFCILLSGIHSAIRHSPGLFSGDGIGPGLAAVGALFAALPFGLIGANLLVRAVPPARRALDREANSVPGTSFRDSQRELLRMAPYISVPAGLVALGGAVLPWAAR